MSPPTQAALDYNMWARQQHAGVQRTWAALRREEDEIEREEAVVVALGQRLGQLRDRIQISPRTHLDALLHQIAKDESRMLQSIDAVGTRLAHEKAVFQREVQRIGHSKSTTPRTDRHTRAAWDYAEQIWRHEEAQIQERIDRVAAMGLDCRRRLAASARRRPSTAAADAEPPEDLQRTPRERRQSTKPQASPPTTERFIRERRPSAAVPMPVPGSAPAPAAPISSREFVRERRPSAAVPMSRPVTAAAARPATAAAAPRSYPAAEEKENVRPRERDRERDRDRDREREREREPRDREREREPRDREREKEPREREKEPRERERAREHHRERTRSSVQNDERMRTAAAWTAYECRWAGLQSPIPSAPTTPLTFHNVPWPVGFQPDSPRSLTPDRIKKFLLSPNHSPHRSPTERLKSALSLWRPEQWDDKWINIVEPSERDKVRYGVSVVAQCIGELLKETRH